VLTLPLVGVQRESRFSGVAGEFIPPLRRPLPKGRGTA